MTGVVLDGPSRCWRSSNESIIHFHNSTKLRIRLTDLQCNNFPTVRLHHHLSTPIFLPDRLEQLDDGLYSCSTDYLVPFVVALPFVPFVISLLIAIRLYRIVARARARRHSNRNCVLPFFFMLLQPIRSFARSTLLLPFLRTLHTSQSATMKVIPVPCRADNYMSVSPPSSHSSTAFLA